MADSSFLKPTTSTSGIGKKSEEKGQFVNPPAFPETGGFDGAKDIGGKSGIMNVEKSPGARKGRN